MVTFHSLHLFISFLTTQMSLKEDHEIFTYNEKGYTMFQTT